MCVSATARLISASIKSNTDCKHRSLSKGHFWMSNAASSTTCKSNLPFNLVIKLRINCLGISANKIYSQLQEKIKRSLRGLLIFLQIRYFLLVTGNGSRYDGPHLCSLHIVLGTLFHGLGLILHWNDHDMRVSKLSEQEYLIDCLNDLSIGIFWLLLFKGSC